MFNFGKQWSDCGAYFTKEKRIQPLKRRLYNLVHVSNLFCESCQDILPYLLKVVTANNFNPVLQADKENAKKVSLKVWFANKKALSKSSVEVASGLVA